MKHLVLAASAALVLAPALAGAQPSAGPDPGNLTRYSRGITARYDNIKRDIVDAADAVPESEYSFRPTPEVRTFGEIISHVADSQNFYCGVADGANPEYATPIEKAHGTKAEIVKALKDSVAKCDAVYAKTTADNAMSIEKAGRGEVLRGMILLDNVAHDNEHYGNIVTYMRLKGHVPPSTLREQKGSGRQ